MDTPNTRMTHKRGFISTIFGLIVMVAIVAGLFYFFFMRKPITPTTVDEQSVTGGAASEVSPDQALEAPATSTVQTTPTNSGTTTYSGKVETFFEGTSTINYSFDYPTDLFTLKEVAKGVQLTEKVASSTAGNVHTITFSYEGARGYAPKDYWANISKNNCPKCTATSVIIPLAGATTTVAYNNANTLVQISAGQATKDWLVVLNITKPTAAMRGVLSTFKITNAN